MMFKKIIAVFFIISTFLYSIENDVFSKASNASQLINKQCSERAFENIKIMLKHLGEGGDFEVEIFHSSNSLKFVKLTTRYESFSKVYEYYFKDSGKIFYVKVGIDFYDKKINDQMKPRQKEMVCSEGKKLFLDNMKFKVFNESFFEKLWNENRKKIQEISANCWGWDSE